MILSDREIRAAIERQAISVTPLPPEEAWTSTALDLQLAPEISLWRRPGGSGAEVIISPSSAAYNFNAIQQQYTHPIVMTEAGYDFEPNTFLLAWTVEKIRLPYRSRLAARVEGKSSLARLGIGVHVTAPTVHGGFGDKPGDSHYPGSPLQLEMWNVGPLTVKLMPKMRICQLIFEWVDGTPGNAYAGRFGVQGPDTPKR